MSIEKIVFNKKHVMKLVEMYTKRGYDITKL